MAKIEQETWRKSPEYWSKLASVYSAKLKANRRSYIYIPLAEAMARLGRTGEAIETLEDGLALLPGSRAAMVLLGRLRRESGDVEGAKAILEKAVARWPDVTAAVFMLCDIYDQEGNLEAAARISSTLADYFPDAQSVRELALRYRKAPENEPGRDGEEAAGAGPPSEEREQVGSDFGFVSRDRVVFELESMLERIYHLRGDGVGK